MANTEIIKHDPTVVGERAADLFGRAAARKALNAADVAAAQAHSEIDVAYGYIAEAHSHGTSDEDQQRLLSLANSLLDQAEQRLAR